MEPSPVAERRFNLFVLIVCLFAIPFFLVAALIAFFCPDLKSPIHLSGIAGGVGNVPKGNA